MVHCDLERPHISTSESGVIKRGIRERLRERSGPTGLQSEIPFCQYETPAAPYKSRGPLIRINERREKSRGAPILADPDRAASGDHQICRARHLQSDQPIVGRRRRGRCRPDQTRTSLERTVQHLGRSRACDQTRLRRLPLR